MFPLWGALTAVASTDVKEETRAEMGWAEQERQKKRQETGGAGNDEKQTSALADRLEHGVSSEKKERCIAWRTHGVRSVGRACPGQSDDCSPTRVELVQTLRQARPRRARCSIQGPGSWGGGALVVGLEL